MANIIFFVADLINWAIYFYFLLIIVDALLSWFPGAYETKLGQLINRLVYPFLRYFNWAHIGPIGFGPILAMVALFFIRVGVSGIANILSSLV